MRFRGSTANIATIRSSGSPNKRNDTGGKTHDRLRHRWRRFGRLCLGFAADGRPGGPGDTDRGRQPRRRGGNSGSLGVGCRRTSRCRCLGDAERRARQHQCANDHDCQARRRPDPRPRIKHPSPRVTGRRPLSPRRAPLHRPWHRPPRQPYARDRVQLWHRLGLWLRRFAPNLASADGEAARRPSACRSDRWPDPALRAELAFRRL